MTCLRISKNGSPDHISACEARSEVSSIPPSSIGARSLNFETLLSRHPDYMLVRTIEPQPVHHQKIASLPRSLVTISAGCYLPQKGVSLVGTAAIVSRQPSLVFKLGFVQGSVLVFMSRAYAFLIS